MKESEVFRKSDGKLHRIDQSTCLIETIDLHSQEITREIYSRLYVIKFVQYMDVISEKDFFTARAMISRKSAAVPMSKTDWLPPASADTDLLMVKL